MRPTWDDIVDPLDLTLVDPLLEWSWGQPDLKEAIRKAYQVGGDVDLGNFRTEFFAATKLWLSGANFVQIAAGAGLSVDDMLGVHSQVITFALQTIVEQGVAILDKVLQSQERELSDAILQFPSHLRFGVPTTAGCSLAAGGVSHRRAYVALGNEPELQSFAPEDRTSLFTAAYDLLNQDSEDWRIILGSLVLTNTLRDLASVIRH